MSSETARSSSTPSGREWALLVIASMLATLPVWIATYPPMADLPEHAAQVAMLHNLHDPAFHFAGVFWINWFTPYLVGYMAVYPLVPWFGIVVACKVVISLALIGLPLATALLMKETGADCYWALLTIPAMYGFSYTWGFLNFLVATPFGLLFLVFVIRHARRPTLRSSIYLGLFAVLLFFCHALICLFFLAIACIYVLTETRNLRTAALALSPIMVALPIMLVWYFRTKSYLAADKGLIWDLGWIHSLDRYSLGGRITGFFPRLLGLRPALTCWIVGVPLFILPFLTGARPIKRLAVWVPLIVCVAVLLFAPTTSGSAWAISHRFIVFVLPFFVIGLGRSDVMRPGWRGAVLFLLIGWLVVTTSHTLRYDAEARGLQQIVSAMQPNQRVLSLMFIREDDNLYPSPVFLHLPAWYSAAKEGVVDMNFAIYPVALVRYRPGKAPTIGSEWTPQTFRWTDSDGDAFRYFVIHAPVDLGYKLFGWAPCPVTLAAQSGNWWLYEKDPQCSASGDN